MKKIIILWIFCLGIGNPLLAALVPETTAFPDANFRAFVKTNYPSCFSGGMFDDACSAVTSATALDVNSQNIADLTGIGYFSALQNLNAAYNTLTVLPSLPNTLRILNVDGNVTLASLPSLPVNLEELYAAYNAITALPSLPNTLKILNVEGNQLSSLPSLPSTLLELFCSSNNLTLLPALPAGLNKLYAYSNQISDILDLSASAIIIGELVVVDNKLEFDDLLPNMPKMNADWQYSPQKQLVVPNSFTVSIGGTISLNVSTAGLGNQYQWYKNNSPIAGATSATYTKTLAGSAETGTYRCDISNPSVPTLILSTNDISVNVGSYVTIPDPNFRAWLVTKYPSCMAGAAGNEQLNTACSAISSATFVNVRNQNISSLEGIQYFTNLKDLQCDHNKLTSLPLLPAVLISLSTYDNQLTSLPSLPVGLKKIWCGKNKLTSLPSLPSGLDTLNCMENLLTSLPPLPSTLKVLTCPQNQLTSLPNLPPALDSLWCYENQLTSLPPLPNSIRYISCWRNALTSLPALPSSLLVLFCHYNQLSSLPTLPSLLFQLDCSYNKITTLPDLPFSMTYLYCNSNGLTALPPLSGGLEFLRCGDNKITTLPTLPNSLESLDAFNNQLSSLPTLPNSIEYMHFGLNKLTTLPNLPHNLKRFYCFNNKLTSLPNLPPNIQELYCDNNQLTTLPSLPNSLDKFTCANNNISSLPALPLYLSNLAVSNNFLTALPTIPNYLTLLYCNDNKIKDLPNLSSSFVGKGNLRVQNNQFEFDDIVPNVLLAEEKKNYAPQASVGISPAFQTVDAGTAFFISVNVGGTGNQYQWYKDSVLIAGANSTTYTVSSSNLGDVGSYYCLISNPSVPDLILNSGQSELMVNATAPVITSVSVVAAIGQKISIKGTNLSPNLNNNQISIGGKTVFADSASYTEIKAKIPLGLWGTVPVQVNVLGKNSNVLSTQVIPTVDVFSPESGFRGDAISVIGTGFSAIKEENEIAFGTAIVPTADIRSASINAISLKVPNGIKGYVAISVKVGNQKGTSLSFFTVSDTELQDFVPQEGYVGDRVNIVGLGFSSQLEDNQVFFGNAQAVVKQGNNNLLVVEVPKGIIGEKVPIRVKIFGQTYQSTDLFTFKVSAITEITPEEGFLGETVSIVGTGFFSTDPNQNAVFFGGKQAQVSKANRTALAVVVPGGIKGKVEVSVTKGGETVKAPQPFLAKIPSFTDINPSSGYPNDVVTLIGEGFSPNAGQNTVLFASVNAEIIKASKYTLTVKVPKMKLSNVKVSVKVSGVEIEEKQDFLVRGVGISDLIPAIGFTGDTVTIIGDGFSRVPSENKVFFGTVSIKVLNSNRTAMSVIVPEEAKGELSVYWEADEKYESPKKFKANIISVDLVVPSSGKVGDLISILGAGFDRKAKVFFDNKETDVTFINSNKLNVRVPPNLFGKVEIKVQDRGDEQKTSFLINAYVLGFTPLQAYVGDQLLFKASGLHTDPNKNIITIGDKLAPILAETFKADQFAVLVPKGTGGTVNVTVNGELLTTNLIVLSKIDKIEPQAASIGEEITIFGTGFSPELNNNTLLFNDIATVPTEVLDDRMKVKVPEGISGETTLNLRVRGAKMVNVSDTFGIIPQIKQFAPTTAPSGSDIAIIGSGFSEIKTENKVFFGDKAAKIVNAGNNRLTVSVPNGNGQVPVKVEVSRQKSLAKDFLIISEIKVVNPNGGEFLRYNNNYTITFTANFESTFKIELLGGKEVLTLATLQKGEKSFTWLVPSFVEKGDTYKIRISSLGEIKTSDESDAVFSIGEVSEDTQISTLYPVSVPSQSREPIKIAIEVGKSLLGLETFFFYKPISANTFRKIAVVSENNRYYVQIPASELDLIGFEYYFQLNKEGRLQAEAPRGRTLIQYPDLEIPYTNFGKNVGNYEILSIPLQLQDDKVTDIFKEELGVYDNRKWRTFRYDRGSTTEFAGGTVKAGEGFWLIIKDKPAKVLMTGAGVTVPTSTDPNLMYSIPVRKGWNQIGNPYLFSLDLENLKRANPELKIDKFYAFENKFVQKTQLTPFRGGFIFLEKEGNLRFPPAPVEGGNSGGRIEKDEIRNPLTAEHWELNLDLFASNSLPKSQEDLNRFATRKEELGGIGMHPEAKIGKDEFDAVAPPKFIEHLGINFVQTDYFYNRFVKDFVQTQENHVWEFTVESEIAERYKTLSWDNSYFGNAKTLILFDLQTNQRIEMNRQNQYTFELGEGKRNFKIYFGDKNFIGEKLKPQNLSVSAYPNPFSNQIGFYLGVPQSGEFNLQIFNALGQSVHSENRNLGESGFYEIQYSSSNLPTGVYYYQVQVDKERFSGKIVRE